MSLHTISAERLTLDDLRAVLADTTRIEVGDRARQLIQDCRDYLDRKVAADQKPVYGINTGFGSLYNKNIPAGELERCLDSCSKSLLARYRPERP